MLDLVDLPERESPIAKGAAHDEVVMTVKDGVGEVRLVDHGGVGVERDQTPVLVASVKKEPQPVAFKRRQTSSQAITRRPGKVGDAGTRFPGPGLLKHELIADPFLGQVQMYSGPAARPCAR